MAKKQVEPKRSKRASVPRTHRHTIVLNDDEQRAVERYLAKYRVANKSKFMREAIIKAIITQLEENHPTLF